jgi:DNA-directed RNA polymerase specialized sigma24 family protein
VNAREVEAALPQFDGLIRETARQIVAAGVEIEYDDVAQLLRIKVWQTIERYDSTHGAHLPLRRFVFGCLYNLRRDIEKRPRRYNHSVEHERSKGDDFHGGQAEAFDLKYLSLNAEDAYVEVEDEPVVLPSTLTATERRVVALRLAGLSLGEVDQAIGLSRFQRAQVMASIRVKLADWAPDGTTFRECAPAVVAHPAIHASRLVAGHSAQRSL